jgi:Secretion system C-terminal sorting domain
MELFLAYTVLENDFIIPNINLNISNYNLVLIVNYKNFNNECLSGIFSDTETINFITPLTGAVSLSNTDFGIVKENFKIFPNPFRESFSVSKTVGKDEDFEFKIIDITGRTVKFGEIFNHEKIYAEALQTGTYILEIRDKKGNHNMKKVVKN